MRGLGFGQRFDQAGFHKRRELVGVTCRRHLRQRNKFQRRGVDAIAQVRRTGPSSKTWPRCESAVRRAHLGSLHAERIVGLFDNFFVVNRLGKTRPAAAGIKLVQRTEQRLAGHDVHINARLVIVPITRCRTRGSVAACCVTANCSGVSFFFSSSALGFLKLLMVKSVGVKSVRALSPGRQPARAIVKTTMPHNPKK